MVAAEEVQIAVVQVGGVQVPEQVPQGGGLRIGEILDVVLGKGAQPVGREVAGQQGVRGEDMLGVRLAVLQEPGVVELLVVEGVVGCVVDKADQPLDLVFAGLVGGDLVHHPGHDHLEAGGVRTGGEIGAGVGGGVGGALVGVSDVAAVPLVAHQIADDPGGDVPAVAAGAAGVPQGDDPATVDDIHRRPSVFQEQVQKALPVDIFGAVVGGVGHLEALEQIEGLIVGGVVGIKGLVKIGVHHGIDPDRVGPQLSDGL